MQSYYGGNKSSQIHQVIESENSALHTTKQPNRIAYAYILSCVFRCKERPAKLSSGDKNGGKEADRSASERITYTTSVFG